MLHKLAVIAELRNQNDDACALYEESLTFGRDLGLDEVVAVMLAQLARVVARQGDHARADALRDEARLLFDYLASVDAGHGAPAGQIARRRSDLARARGLFEESLAWYRQAGDREGELFALSSLGGLAEARSDYAESARLYRTFLGAAAAAHEWGEVAMALQRLGVVAAAQGEPRYAATLAGAAAGLRRRWALSVGPRDDMDADLGRDQSVFAAAFRRAQELSDAEAIAVGLSTTI
jgi:hypothetical protein